MLVGKGAWLKFGKKEPKPHLWIIIADLGDEVLVVNLTAFRQDHDPACVFTKGEYPIITKKSYILYAKAEFRRTEAILKKQFHPIDPDMFAKIIQGAKKSAYFDYKNLL